MKKEKRSNFFIILIVILAIPTFLLMLRFGIYSMQDFHFFRLLEFDKCLRDLQIPCRWAADSGAGYGEPIYNFYGQFPYVIGEVFRIINFSLVDSLKLIFIFSLIGSVVGMFFLSKKIWKDNWAALVSSTVYLYAPYRALDVWVRGALPEALSFVFFPLVILEIENYLEGRKKKDLLIFSLLLALMIINHNLSMVLFGPFLIVWIIYRFLQIKDFKPFLELGIAGVFSGLLSAFYLLPVIFESKFVNIGVTTLGVYDWRANFAKISQVFISRFWGYGGSIDGKLSLSIGQIQWVIPALCLPIVIFNFFKRKFSIYNLQFTILLLIGILCLFLTHNKSTSIWNTLTFMKYIQFPWRFLGTATFAFALSSGFLIKNSNKFKWTIGIAVIITAVLLNYNFFRPDIWYKIADFDLESGSKWIESTFSSLPDYWPIYGPLPNKEAPTTTNDFVLLSKTSNTEIFRIQADINHVEFPLAYFPGWQLNYGGKNIEIAPDKNGLISAILPMGGDKIATLKFINTPVRSFGNIISLVSLIVWLCFFVRLKYEKNNRKV